MVYLYIQLWQIIYPVGIIFGNYCRSIFAEKALK